MIVVDASAVVEILAGTDIGLNLGAALAERTLNAPHLIDLEVAQVLRRWAANSEMTASDAERALEVFRDMPLRRHAHTALLSEIWRLRHNLTAYDAAYLALAWLLDAELVTMDEGLENEPAAAKFPKTYIVSGPRVRASSERNSRFGCPFGGHIENHRKIARVVMNESRLHKRSRSTQKVSAAR